jgi:hypothetical protein
MACGNLRASFAPRVNTWVAFISNIHRRQSSIFPDRAIASLKSLPIKSLLPRVSHPVYSCLIVELGNDLHAGREFGVGFQERRKKADRYRECRHSGLYKSVINVNIVLIRSAAVYLKEILGSRSLTRLKADVFKLTPAELTINSRTPALGEGNLGARNGVVGRIKTSYLSRAA